MLTVGLIALLLTAPEPVHEAEIIFPPQPLHNHASSIVETPGGDLLVVWFNGTGERKNDDVQLLGARLEAEARTAGRADWSVPFPMADSQDLPDCNPVLFVDPRGTLWLFWVAIQDNLWGSALLKYRTTGDFEGPGAPRWQWQDVIHVRPRNLEARVLASLDGMDPEVKRELLETEVPEEIEAIRAATGDKLACRLGWMTRLHPVMTSDTRMMLGLYSDIFNCSLAAFTEDWGKTWSFSEPIIDPDGSNLGNIQPAFVVHKDGDITAFMRDNGSRKRVPHATSTDGGITWSPLARLDIPNPGSSVDCMALASGNWVLIFNDQEAGRHRLTAYLSTDEGATWPWSRPLEDQPKDGGNFSYPSVIEARDGLIHCTYSWRQAGTEGSSIKHARFNEAWVRAGQH